MRASVAIGTGVTALANDVQRLIASLTAPWVEGFGPGELQYRLDLPAPTEVEAHTSSIFVTAESVTLWDGSARHVNDPNGAIAGYLNSTMPQQGAPPAGHGVPPPSGPPVFRQTLLNKRENHSGFVIDGPHKSEHVRECCMKVIRSDAHGVFSRTSITMKQRLSSGDDEQKYDLPRGSEVVIYPNGDIVIQIV